MSSWGRLDQPPAEHGWEFPPAEYRRRVGATRRRMIAAAVDCLFLTSEKNIRYLTGFHSQTWVSPTRPRYVLLPVEGEPVAVVSTSNVPGVRATTWLEDVRAWPAPRPADDGVSLVIDALRGLAGPRGRVAAEIGPEMRVQMPVADFLRIREPRPGPFLDAGPVIRPVRMVKWRCWLEISQSNRLDPGASAVVGPVPSSGGRINRGLPLTVPPVAPSIGRQSASPPVH